MADAVRLEPVGFARVSLNIGLRMPQTIRDEIMKSLRSDMREARARLQANVSGGVLRRRTGQLFSSIRSSVRFRNHEFIAKSGSKLYYGRFWEDGFTRRGKHHVPRRWAEPVRAAMNQRIVANVEAAVGRGIQRGEG